MLATRCDGMRDCVRVGAVREVGVRVAVAGECLERAGLSGESNSVILVEDNTRVWARQNYRGLREAQAWG